MTNEVMKIDVESLKQDATKIALEAYFFFNKYIKPLKPATIKSAIGLCVKCGHDDIYVRFCKGTYHDISCGVEHKGEILHKTCRSCQYHWNDKPLDSK